MSLATTVWHGTESVTITIGGAIRPTGIYVHPGLLFPVEAITDIRHSGPRHLIARDFHVAHPSWSKGQTNQHRRRLFRLANDKGLVLLHPDGVTMDPYGPGEPRTIDLVVNKNVDTARNSRVHHNLSSNHWPATFDVGESSVG